MKQIILILLLSLFTINCDAIVTTGDVIDIQTGLIGSAYHPRINLVQYDSEDEFEHQDFLNLIMITSDTYQEFPENSKMLLKLDNGEILELDSYGGVTKDYSSSWNSFFKKYDHYYYVARKFILEEDDLNLILTHPIIKVRVELINGNIKDYDIKDKHAKKVMKKLNETYDKILKAQSNRLKNVNSDLKTDF